MILVLTITLLLPLESTLAISRQPLQILFSIMMFFVDQLIGTIKNANNKMKGD
jgi:hypothetical protein